MELVYIVNVYPYYDLEVFDSYTKAFNRLVEMNEENNWKFVEDEIIADNGRVYRIITKEVK